MGGLGAITPVRRDGTPINFFDVDVRSHLAFYRAGIAAITEEDEYAGLLVSMHGAGIYRQRYGLDTSLGLTRAAEVQGDVDAFVAEQEAKFGGDPGERQADYELLQLFDRLSLYFCMRDVVAGEAAELQGYRLEPVGPWRVKLAPYPFGRARPTSRCSGGSCRRVAPSTSSPRAAGDGDHDRVTAVKSGPLRGPTTSADETRASSGVVRAEPAHVGLGGAGTPQSSRIAAARTGEPYATSSRSGRPTNRNRCPSTSFRLFRFS